jgi:tRNA nucleotidyltransferase (CCA-adding enzyme)
MRIIALFVSVPHGNVPGILRSLRFSNADQAWISSIVAQYQSLKDEMRDELMANAPPSDASIRRWAALAGRTRLASVLRVASARWAAERDAGESAPDARQVRSVYRRALRIAYRDPIEIGDLAVNGRDLEKIGITGLAVGRTLRSLLETVINDPAANSYTDLLERAVTLKNQH